MKKILKYLILSVFCLSLLACSKDKDIVITMYTNTTDQNISFIKIKEVIDKFEKENEGIKIDFQAGSSEYESTMKTRMASNDLPDLFVTHGWSIARYKEYLEPLENREWAKNISPLIKNMITSDGHLYVLPIDMDVTGIVYNVDVLNKLNVNVDDIKTIDDFIKVSQKALDAGYIPLQIGGKDPSKAASFIDWLGSSFLITTNNNQKENLLNGKYDINAWLPFFEFMKSYTKYLNKDLITATDDDTARLFAENKVLFSLSTNSIIKEAKQYNPNVNMAFMPIPALNSNSKPSLIVGEGTYATYGVWKDSKNKEIALKFLDYLAKEENVKLIDEATGSPTGLTTVNIDNKELTKYYKKYENIQSIPYLDRAYLPSGIWSTLCDISIGIFSGQMTPEQANERLKLDYLKLYNAQH